jgi:branched-chain amino acid aminotransferase
MHPHILYNDQVLPAGEKILAAGQLGVLSGWGIFTTLRIYDGVLFEWNRHWQRMTRDARVLHVDLPQDADTVHAHLLDLVRKNQAHNAVMRLCVVRSEGGFWAGPGSGNPSDVVAMTAALKKWQDSVTLDVAEHGRYAASPFAGTKTLSWSHNLTLAEKAVADGYDEVILLNECGEVSECTSANLFAAKDGVTYTPPLSSGALPGITRLVMLEELKLADAPVREKTLRIEDLFDADEVFITSTTRELIPVHRIRDRTLTKGGPEAWPVMARLHGALTGYVKKYVEQSPRRAAA